MPLSVAELLQALPDPASTAPVDSGAFPARLTESHDSVPVGRWRRMTLLGSLQAKIAAGYLFHWLRGWFCSEQEYVRQLAEVHWRMAVRLFDSMGYMRGAVMKIGQTLANFPDVAPREFVETLDRLYFEAPAMHWSLLREMVINELGDEPERLFAEFDRHAFAAASLGQVHRARLHTGEEVVVKIQYPGIARSVRDDFSNLLLLLLPNRLGRDWQNLRDQVEDLRSRLEQETDYELEARYLKRARQLFDNQDEIIVPQVYPRFSTSRILTMEYVPGVHLNEFLARNPDQQARDEAGIKLVRGWYRLMYAGRMLYNDYHPGNLLFLDDGRIGLIDFGNILDLDDEIWELCRRIDRPMTTGVREDRIAAMKYWANLADGASDQMRLYDAFCEWNWRPRSTTGSFSFGDEGEFKRGVELFAELARKRYSSGHRTTFTMTRGNFGWRSILYRLQATFDLQALAEQEIAATGWDRDDYARAVG